MALTRRPGMALLGGAALLAVSVAVALGAPQRLATGAIVVEGGPPPPQVVVRTSGKVAVGSRVYDVALDVIRAQLASNPDVARVRTARSAGGVDLLVTLVDLASDERQDAVERMGREIDPGPLRITLAGQVADLQRSRDLIGGELWRLALLALPLVTLAVVLALGLRMALAALAAATLSIAGAAAALRLLGGPLDVSLLALPAAAPVGVAVSLELAALLRRRDTGAPTPTAGLERSRLAFAGWLAPAGLSVVAAAIAPLALLASPVQQAPSLVLGATLAALLAAVGVALFGSAALAWDPVGEGSDGASGHAATRPGRRLAKPLLLALSLAALTGAIALALMLLERPAGLDLLGLAPETVPEAAALPAALAAVLAVICSRSALALAVLAGEGSDPLRARARLWRGSVLSSLALGAGAGVLVGADESATALFGLVVAGGAVLDLLAVRVPFLLVAGRRRAAADSTG